MFLIVFVSIEKSSLSVCSFEEVHFSKDFHLVVATMNL